MAFLSIGFFAFLTVVALAFYLLPPGWRTGYLLGVSYLLCAAWSPISAVLLLLLSLASYRAGLFIAAASDERRRLMLLLGALVVTGGALVVFKIMDAVSGILVPLGLSYYSFKLISYFLDVYWGEPPATDIIAFLLYSSFFPQIVAGPIQRAPDFLTQQKRLSSSSADVSSIDAGLRLIIGGMLLKFALADRIALFVSTVDVNPASFTRATLALTACCFTLQLYADFAGYTNIARGLGKLFGIDAPRNFAAPFAATNLPEMWRRWHITLTRWIGDYVYIPLHMALRDWGNLGLMASVATSMILVGIWHGLTVNFFVFGLYHAVLACLTVLSANWRHRLLAERGLELAGQAIGIIFTFLLMSFSQIFWHFRTWNKAVHFVGQLLGIAPDGSTDVLSLPENIANGCFVSAFAVAYIGSGCPGLSNIKSRLGTVPDWLVLAIGLLLLSASTVQQGSTFIYGHF